jgi:hypothetical protein
MFAGRGVGAKLRGLVGRAALWRLRGPMPSVEAKNPVFCSKTTPRQWRDPGDYRPFKAASFWSPAARGQDSRLIRESI